MGKPKFLWKTEVQCTGPMAGSLGHVHEKWYLTMYAKEKPTDTDINNLVYSFVKYTRGSIFWRHSRVRESEFIEIANA